MVEVAPVLVCDGDLLRLYKSSSKQSKQKRLVAAFSGLRDGAFREEQADKIPVWSGQSGQDVPAVLAQAYALDREIGLKFPYLCYESSPSLTSEGAELDVVTLAVGHVDRWSQCFELDTFLELGRSETIFACRLVDGPAVIVCTDAALYYASKDSQGMWALALCPHTQLPSQVRVLLADVKVGAWDNSVAILAAVCVGVCDGKEMWSWVTWSARCSSVSATVGENPYGFPQSYAAVAACAHVIRPSATGAGASTGEDVFLATTTNRLLRFRWQTLVSTCVLPHTPAEVLAPPSQLGHSMLLVRFADVEGTLHVYHSCRQMSGYPEPVHVMSGVRHFFVSNFLGIEDGVPGGANDGVEGSPCKWLGFQLLALTAEFGLFMRKWDGVRGVRLTDFVRTYCGLDRDGRASALTRAVDTTTCQTLFSLAASFRARCEAGQTRCTQLERSLREKVQLYRHGLDLLGVVSTPRELFSQVDCLRRGLLPMLGKKAGARGGFTVSPTGLLDRDDTRVVSTAILSLDRLSLSYDAKLDMWSISLHITNTSRARLHRLSLSLLSAHGKVQSSSQYCHCLGPRKGAYLILRFQGKQLISKSVSSFKLLVTADAASVEKGESNDSVDYVCECVGMRCLCVLGSVDHACDSLDLRRELQVDLGDVSLPPRLLHSWRSSHVFLAKSEDHYAHHFQFRSQVRVSLKGPSSTDLAGSLGECVTDGRVDESEARVTVSRHPQLPSQWLVHTSADDPDVLLRTLSHSQGSGGVALELVQGSEEVRAALARFLDLLCTELRFKISWAAKGQTFREKISAYLEYLSKCRERCESFTNIGNCNGSGGVVIVMTSSRFAFASNKMSERDLLFLSGNMKVKEAFECKVN